MWPGLKTACLCNISHFGLKKRKARVFSEDNPLSSLHKQVDLQHVKNYICINLQVYLLTFDLRAGRELI